MADPLRREQLPVQYIEKGCNVAIAVFDAKITPVP
jgi:hypothetical protein